MFDIECIDLFNNFYPFKLTKKKSYAWYRMGIYLLTYDWNKRINMIYAILRCIFIRLKEKYKKVFITCSRWPKNDVRTLTRAWGNNVFDSCKLLLVPFNQLVKTSHIWKGNGRGKQGNVWEHSQEQISRSHAHCSVHIPQRKP